MALECVWMLAGRDLLPFLRIGLLGLVFAIPSKHWGALRAFALITFATVFLLVSPGLRGVISSDIGTATGILAEHAPYSYVGVVAASLGVLYICICRGSRPR